MIIAILSAFGVLFIGGFYICILIGFLGFFEILSDVNKNYLFYNGKLYKKIPKNGLWKTKDEDIVVFFGNENEIIDIFDIER